MRTILLMAVFLGHCLAFADTTLVSYGFDKTLPSAADGFYIFQNSKGYVVPTDEAVFSGYRSLEIHEAPLDGTFAELQGIISPIDNGDVLFHFAILIKDVNEELNIALAGPQHFFMQPNGMLFWLKTMKGVLYHHSDAMPKRLAKLESNKWYVVDALLHLEKGTYDLRILEDGVRQPIAVLRDQVNAVNFPGSKLMKISFIGDLEDRSSVQYFVDDVELRVLSSPLVWPLPTDAQQNAAATAPTVQPASNARPEYLVRGDRSSKVKSYFDEYLELKRLESDRPTCLPATAVEDFGVTQEELRGDPQLAREIKEMLEMKESEVGRAALPTSAGAQAVYFWRDGCMRLAAGETSSAAERMRESLKQKPESTVGASAMASIASAQKNRMEAEKFLLKLYQPWASDARLPVLIGMVASAWSNYGDAAEALRSVAGQLSEEQAGHLIGELLSGDDVGFDELERTFGNDWRRQLDDLFIAQNYYHSLLFGSKFSEAIAFSRTMTAKYGKVPAAEARWKERLADALVLSGDLDQGRAILRSLAAECSECRTLQRKVRRLGGRE